MTKLRTRAAPTARTHTLIVAEPPPAYITHPPLVVDCSALSAFLFAEPMREEALQQLTGRSLHAPTLLDHEIASVAFKKRRQNWPPAAIDMALADYAELRITLHRCDLAAQVGLAERYALSAYDAAYLWLAAEMKAPLATFDKALGLAAQAHLSQLK